MAKATKTIRQSLGYQPAHAAWFAAMKDLFNQVAAFYFEVIAAHEKVLDCSNKEALTVLETLTHATQKNPTPVMPLAAIAEDIPAMFRRAAIHAALGSARSFYSLLRKWKKRQEQAQAKGKQFTERPPVPPVPGTSPPRCMQVSGRNGPDRPLCSKCGQGRVGVGSRFASLDGNSRRMSRWEVLPLFGAAITGGCIRLLQSSSLALAQSRNTSPQMHKQRCVP